MPALRAAVARAPSVGSPSTLQPPSPSRSCALLASTAAASSRRASVRCAPSRRGSPSASSSPCGAYPVPVTSVQPDAVASARTVISLRVRVPVLSLAMTVAEPSVSTAERRRTMALRRAIRCMPSDRTTVVTAASPSGTADTASDTV